jgi:ABC-type polysaccharide/polyol phosphate transport system ATPase subunit/ABC-type polysaccharide/polyol phosphate export permease
MSTRPVPRVSSRAIARGGLAAVEEVGTRPGVRLGSVPAAVSVQGVGKTFRVPHHRHSTLKQRLVDRFRPSSYEVLRAVNDVSFEVARGEFFGIVGRNGSGKSTLLRCVAGIYQPDSGAISVSGRLSPFVEMGVGLKPDLSARDNVLINATLLGLTRKQAQERFDEIIAFAELEEFVDLELKNFSSGMKVRLAFSVAIQVDADVLLVDEVLAVGDAAFQKKCFEQFERLKAEGRTMLFVTHSMGAIERYCDRATLLERGEMVSVGDPASIAEQYRELNARLTERRKQGDHRHEGANGPGLDSRGLRSVAFAAATPASYMPSAFGDGLRRFASVTLTLAVTEFRLHYLRSALGYLWSLLRPLTMFVVFYLVFARAAGFGRGVEDYPVYLLSAIVLWTFFAETASGGVSCITRGAGLLRKMRFPRMALPLSVTLKALFNLGVNSALVVVVVIAAGVEPRASWLELPLLVGLLVILATGVAMLLSPLYVRYRDVGQVWSLAQQVLFFGSPILYGVTRYPDEVESVLAASPLAMIFTQMRHVMIDPSAPTAAAAIGDPALLAIPLGIVAGVFVLGLWVFNREAPRIAERL